MKPASKNFYSVSAALFILPNIFTISGIFCGMFAIIQLTNIKGAATFYDAALAIFFAGFFDMFDGRVARLTKTQSEFGVQMDSLADAISFGVAPGILIYKWALWPLGPVGVVAAFCYTACGVIRLARFNVAPAERIPDERHDTYFTGLPIPAAAGALILLVMAHYRLFPGLGIQNPWVIMGITIGLAILMVSNVPYWTFKKVPFSVSLFFFIVVCSVTATLTSFGYPASMGLLGLLVIYITSGFILYVLSKLKSIISSL